MGKMEKNDTHLIQWDRAAHRGGCEPQQVFLVPSVIWATARPRKEREEERVKFRGGDRVRRTGNASVLEYFLEKKKVQSGSVRKILESSLLRLDLRGAVNACKKRVCIHQKG